MRTSYQNIFRAAFCWLGAAAILLTEQSELNAQDLRIMRFEINADGVFEAAVGSVEGSYYVLLHGAEAGSVSDPIHVIIGTGSEIVVRDGRAASARSRAFYRIQQVPLSAPLDLDGDGIDDGYELERASFLDPLDPSDAAGDFDQDGVLNLAEYRQRSDPTDPLDIGLTRVAGSSPFHGEDSVSVTRKTTIRFSSPLQDGNVIGPEQISVSFAGRSLEYRSELSSDRLTVALFYRANLPANSRIQVRVHGDVLRDFKDRMIDADGDGHAGGTGVIRFDTLNNVTVSGTTVVGHVFASEPNGDGSDRPLAGVRITVDGREAEQFAVTDASGRFVLDPAPLGRFFAHIDGRAVAEAMIGGAPVSTRFPEGPYFPFVGKPFVSVAGEETDVGNIYLPVIAAGSLQPVSLEEDTVIGFPEAVIAQNPLFDEVRITVPAGSLFANDGSRGGRVGIAPVPPERLPGRLPDGLTLPVVITVQTDGATNFDRPAPVCFPNLPDPDTGRPLEPGSKSALISFNHDTGRWELAGSMTVSEDGRMVCSDPGVGIRAPGWHGTWPFSSADGGGAGPRRPRRAGGGDGDDDPFDPDDPDDPDGGGRRRCNDEIDALASAEVQCTASTAFALVEAIPVVGCAVNFGLGVAGSAVDCSIDSEHCGRTIALNTVGTLLGCIPIAGGVLGPAWTCSTGMGFALDAYSDCVRSGAGAAAAGATGVLGASGANVVIEQRDLWANAAEVYGLVLGDDVWTRVHPEELRKVRDFVSEMGESLDPESDAGTMLSADERIRLSAMPRPITITEADVTRLLDRMNLMVQGLLGPDEFDTAGLIASAQSLSDRARRLEDQGWTTILEGSTQVRRLLLRARTEAGTAGEPAEAPSPATREELLEQIAAFSDLSSGDVASDALALVPLHYRLTNLDNGRHDRGRLTSQGAFDGVFLVPNTFYRVDYLHPDDLRIGTAVFRSPPTGRTGSIPRAILVDPLDRDLDDDRLPDISEYILGTSPIDPDTDGDGITDAFEILQGLDPLEGRGRPRGIIGSAGVAGDAWDVCTAGDLAIVAADSVVAVYQISRPADPVLAAQFDVEAPGRSRSVACNNRFAIAATESGGIMILDISNPADVRVRHRIRLESEISTVEVSGDVAYAGGGDLKLRTIDLESGLILATTDLPEPAADLSAAGSTLAVLGPDQIMILDTQERFPEVTLLSVTRGHLLSDTVGSRIFNADPIVYYTHFDGYNTIDISDPTDARALGFPGFTIGTFHGIAFDGSNTVISTLSRGADDWPVGIFDGSDPSRTDRAILDIHTSGHPVEVSLHNGLVYVADLDGGFQVINYLEPDIRGQAPAIQLQSQVSDVVEEGKRVQLTATTSDDVFVRSVEFYINGRLVLVDGTFPFEHAFITPRHSGETRELRMRARASDTAGNERWSEETTLVVAEDTTPPSIQGSSPGDMDEILEGLTRLWIRFSEPLSAADLTDTAFVLSGPDGAVMEFTKTRFLNSNRMLLFQFEPLNSGDHRLEIDPAGVTDLAGNPLRSEPESIRFTVTALPRNSVNFPMPTVVAVGTEDSPGGTVATALDAADLTGDQITDVAVTVDSFNIRRVYVHPGFGDGSFQSPSHADIAATPVDVVAADLNNDDALDLAIAHRFGGDQVTVLLNDGLGGFSRSEYEVVQWPERVAVADVNGDGFPDILTINNSSNDIAVLAGSAEGLFGEASYFPVGGFVGPVDFFVTAMNADSHLDILTANTFSSDVSLLIGGGDGTFIAAEDRVAFSGQTRGVLGLDLNGDGLKDVVAISDENAFLNVPDHLSVALQMEGSDPIRFAEPRTFDVGMDPVSFSLEDMDGDTVADALTMNATGRNVSLLPGIGDGSFGFATEIPLHLKPRDHQVADLNRDGLSDLVLIASEGLLRPRIVSVLQAAGGGFPVLEDLSVLPEDGSVDYRPHNLAVGDLNGDGVPDFLATSSLSFAPSSPVVSVLLSRDGGGFDLSVTEVPQTPVSLMLRHVNGDAHLDRVVLYSDAGRDALSIEPGNGDGTFGAAIRIQFEERISDIAVTPLNGDALPDILIGSASFERSMLHILQLPDGSFADPTPVGFVPADPQGFVSEIREARIRLADMNNDQRLDIIAGNPRSNFKIFFGNEDLTFTDPGSFIEMINSTDHAVADVNRDGNADLIVGRTPNQVAVFLGDGLGGVGEPVIHTVHSEPRHIRVLDIDGDGEADLVSANADFTFTVFRGDGSGAFDRSIDYWLGGDPRGFAVTDLDGDGDPDVIATDPETRSLRVSRNNASDR